MNSNIIIEKLRSFFTFYFFFLNHMTLWYLSETLKPLQGGIWENPCQSLDGRIMTLRFKSYYNSTEYGSKNK